MNIFSPQKFIIHSSNKSPKSKSNISKDIPSQCFSTIKKSYNKTEKYLINCNKTLDKKERDNIKYNNNINNESDEELAIIQSLWDDLGIYIDYQEEFKDYIKKITNEEKKNEILNLEKSQLRKYREALLKLSAEISNREANVIKLKKYCKELDKYSLDKNTDDFPSDIFKNIQKTIKYYRINTVNVINKIMRLREVSSYYELNKKWDPAMANRAYLYNKCYTITMFNDIKFINNSILFNYLETDNNIKKTDLFLSNCKHIVTNEGKKLILSISLELQNAINKCKYIILQDTLFNNIKNDKKLMEQRNISSPKRLSVNGAKPKKSMSEVSLVNDKSEKKFVELFGHKKVNLSRTLYYLKRTMGNQYEKMFLNSNNIRNNNKKNMEIMNQYFSFRKFDDDMNNIDINLKNSNNNTINQKESKLNEQLNKNSEDMKSIEVDKKRINKIKTGEMTNLVNFESNLDNTTNKENNNNKEESKDTKTLNKSKEETIPVQKEINKENKEEKINILENKETEKQNDINNTDNNNNKNIENINEKKDIKEQSDKSSKISNEEKNINTNKDIDKDIENNINTDNKDINNNSNNSNNNSVELNQDKNNENIMEAKPEEENLNSSNKEIKANESIEEKEEQKENENTNENNIKDKKQTEFEEKSIKEKIKENKNVNNFASIDKGEFEEISVDNNLKDKQEESPKVKLLQYRKYTEEEMKKINKDEDDDDEFISVDYDKL